ncbi:MAG TPA: ACS family MFS transporter [Candidatus Binatia bacterium]|nr:ACS family MFS transporter [Candidatus Binatia bacterium]
MATELGTIAAARPTGWPRRFTVVLFFFTCALILYIDRVNISVVAPVLMTEFGWDPAATGTILSAFFVGYLLTQLPGGWLADRFGGKSVIGFAVAWWSLATFLTPFASVLPLMLAVRIGLGIGEGVTPPALHSMTARWIPVHERTRVIAFDATGVYVGIMLSFPLSVWVVTHWGWPWVFYSFGVLGVLWAVLWYLLVTSRPEEHPTISAAELAYIRHDLPKVAPVEAVPWRLFFSSSAFWALLVGQFCTLWTWYMLLTWLPIYLVKARGFSLEEMGIYAMLPYGAMLFAANGAGWLADGLIRRDVSITLVRKGFQSLCFVGSALCLLLLSATASQWLALLYITLGLGAVATSAAGFLVNHLDIGPRYAGVLMGLTNTAGTIPGILAPFITGLIVQFTGSWALVFYLAAGISAVGEVIWLLFASGEQVFE